MGRKPAVVPAGTPNAESVTGAAARRDRYRGLLLPRPNRAEAAVVEPVAPHPPRGTHEVEVRQRAVEMVGDERASVAALLPVGRKHEMIENELAASVEQLLERTLPRLGVEHIIFVDAHPGQRPPLLHQPASLRAATPAA